MHGAPGGGRARGAGRRGDARAAARRRRRPRRGARLHARHVNIPSPRKRSDNYVIYNIFINIIHGLFYFVQPCLTIKLK